MFDPTSPDVTALPVHLRHTFNISHKSELDNKLYEGQFTTKKLSIREQANVAVTKSKLNGGFYHDDSKPGVGIDELTDITNGMLAHLEICLIQKPGWFSLDNVYDTDLVIAVWKEVAKFESSFSSPLGRAAASNGSSQVDSGETSQGAGAVGRVTAVGSAEVQSALDPQ